MGNRLPFRNTEGEFLYALSVPSGQLPRGESQGAFADVEVKNTFSEGQTDEILSAE